MFVSLKKEDGVFISVQSLHNLCSGIVGQSLINYCTLVAAFPLDLVARILRQNFVHSLLAGLAGLALHFAR
jgi:hypothetical protein